MNTKKHNHLTIHNDKYKILDSDRNFNYQKELTKSLDKNDYDIDQNKINEIVLWKVNRYVKLGSEVISLINHVGKTDTKIDIDLTKNILEILLAKETKGVQLPMASTILRFRNRNIYQIIDQRVYRSIYSGEILKLNNYPSKKNIEDNLI